MSECGAGRAARGEGDACEHFEPLRARRLREELARCQREMERLSERLSGYPCEHREACGGCAGLEREIAELGNHCVVLELLHETYDRASVHAAIQDVVINVIGSEDMAIFEPSPDGRRLSPARVFAPPDRRLGEVSFGEGPIGRAAEGAAWVVGEGPQPADAPDLTACVPLVSERRLEAVLAIWRMLPQKPVFGAADRKVLRLLANHAAEFLHRASRCERHAAGAVEASP